jgi:hypothetical protein
MTERRAATEKAERERHFAKVCINLQRSPDPNVHELLKWFVDEFVSASFENNQLDGLALARNQGKALFINRLLERILGAPEAMANLQAAISQRVVRGRGKLGGRV